MCLSIILFNYFIAHKYLPISAIIKKEMLDSFTDCIFIKFSLHFSLFHIVSSTTKEMELKFPYTSNKNISWHTYFEKQLVLSSAIQDMHSYDHQFQS